MNFVPSVVTKLVSSFSVVFASLLLPVEAPQANRTVVAIVRNRPFIAVNFI
jgi:hypothetical protein